MICPNCKKELKDGNLYCENCGYEIQIVPDFEPEIENSINETLSEMAEGFDEEEELWSDFDESLEKPDYLLGLKEKIGHFQYKKIALFASCIIVAFLIMYMGFILFQNNSYRYQLSKAITYAEKNDYEHAIKTMEKAMSIYDKDTNGILYLADFYIKSDRRNQGIAVLENCIFSGYADEAVYRKLFRLYSEEENYERISEILNECKEKEILDLFQDFVAKPPEFSVSEGTYYEITPLKLISNTSGTIYFTLDGSVPSVNSRVYTSPIFLESGKYQISAMFVNSYGVQSDIVVREYFVDATRPYAPEVNLYSGDYSLPELIEVEMMQDCYVYYTTDGSEPSLDSNLYTTPIPMPIGSTQFKFVTATADGVLSDSVERVYNLAFDYRISIEDAVNQTVVAIFEKGEILDKEGHVPNMTGRNLYICNSAITFGNQPYYLIVEQYQDINGTIFHTGNQYAVNAVTGLICKVKIQLNGDYQVIPY